MLVNRTASDVAAARERNLCALILSKQCSNKIIGSTNFTDILIIYAYLTDRRCIDLYGMPVNPLYLSTNLRNRLEKDIDVPHIRQILYDDIIIGHNSSRQNTKRRILRPADHHISNQWITALHNKLIHGHH